MIGNGRFSAKKKTHIPTTAISKLTAAGFSGRDRHRHVSSHFCDDPARTHTRANEIESRTGLGRELTVQENKYGAHKEETLTSTFRMGKLVEPRLFI